MERFSPFRSSGDAILKIKRVHVVFSDSHSILIGNKFIYFLKNLLLCFFDQNYRSDSKSAQFLQTFFKTKQNFTWSGKVKIFYSFG